MINIGQINQLDVVEQLKNSFLLEGGRYGDIQIAKNELPQGTKIGQQVKAFVFIDSD
ncbi:MAG: S1 RNA-binding domain-containing protein, partial [Pseudomonadales bacterium]|nr:S1 RNA-binding domain-containing protein [Pseudomonadales bacterium]